MPKTLTPMKGQIVIMPSIDVPFSSDDSFTLDVGTYSIVKITMRQTHGVT